MKICDPCGIGLLACGSHQEMGRYTIVFQTGICLRSKDLHGMKSDSDSVSQRPQRGDPQISLDGATTQLVAKFSRLYAQAALEDQLVLRVWMRDIILGRGVGSASAVRARRMEKRMVGACERRILEFP